MKFRRPSFLQGALFAIGMLLTAAFAWHENQNAPQGFALLHALERDAYDLRLTLGLKQGLDPRIIIIDIDEESLKRVGQWPWPRAKLAQLVEQLFNQYDIDTLGFDIVFAEAETHITQDALKFAYQDLGGVTNSRDLQLALSAYQGDTLLAKAIKDRNVVLGYFFEGNSTVDNVGTLPRPFISDSTVVSETEAPIESRFSANVDVLQVAGTQAGFFSLASITDVDGIIRRVALLNKYDDKLYAALPLMMAQQFLGFDAKPILAQQALDTPYAALEALDIGLGKIPLDSQGAVFVPYRDPKQGYRYVPAWQILAGEVDDAEVLSGTLALLGASASGLVDLRNTPLQNAFPGVEVHASILSGILDGNFHSQPEWTRGLTVTMILALGVLLSSLLPVLSIAKATILSFVALCGLLLSNAYFWFKLDWVVPIASLCLLALLIYLLNAIVGFFAESRSRQIMRRMFGLYIPPQIVDEMSATPDVYSLKSEKREMTVFFSDVRGFTTISESLSPEELSILLNALLTPITEIIHRHKGAIDKYLGDAVMAFWGAPVPTERHAREAIDAALEVIEKLEHINNDFTDRKWPEMRMGIGISTGPMSVGNMGSEFRMAYTVLGDSVNLGSRLEGLTKLYGVDVIVSEATKLAAPEYVYQLLDTVRVKGKQKPEKIYSPLALEVSAGQSRELEQYALALNLYRGQAWQAAHQAFSNLHEMNERVLYALYLDRILELKGQAKIENWDGVTNLTHK